MEFESVLKLVFFSGCLLLIGYTAGALLFQPEERLIRMIVPSLVALLEAALLWVSTSAAIFMWVQPSYAPWTLLPLLSAKAAVPSFCCIFSFHYNDLYNLRVVRSFRDFGSRLLQSFGVAFILLAACWASSPEVRISSGAFGISLLATVGVLLPFRALWYTLMRRHRQT